MEQGLLASPPAWLLQEPWLELGGLSLARARDQGCLGKASGETHLLHPTEGPWALPPWLAPAQSQASPRCAEERPTAWKMALSLQLQICKNPARVNFFLSILQLSC